MFLKAKNELIFLEYDFLNEKECKFWFEKSTKLNNYSSWEERTVDITKTEIVKKVQDFFKNKLNLSLKIRQAQIQNWHEGSFSNLHVHNVGDRENTKFNSLIYLNDDFKGGEFFTKNGIIIKPKKGLLTLFNGSKVYHGVNKVLNKDRITLIFWWNK
jgi:Rps23 Pro-64 3,4-dihydroxylase Tpa1-like proline 4-hydroxylase